MKRFALLLLSLLSAFFVFASNDADRRKDKKPAFEKRTEDLKISGIMADSETGEPLPFSNVFIKRSLVGTQTDFDGLFSLVVPARSDTVWFSAMGYREQLFRVDQLKNPDSLVIAMKPDNIAIDEIVVRPDDAPRRLLKAVVKAKGRNNPESHQRAEFEKYTRWQYSLGNINDRAKNTLLLRDAQNLMQISGEDSSRYLPVYFSETLCKNELQREPRKARSTVLADRVKGVDLFKQYEIGGLSSAIDNEINFYDDVVKIFSIGFVSPIAKDCFHYYDFFIIDSTSVAAPKWAEQDSVKSYTVKFRPKNAGDKAFEGTMDIETLFFSPTRIDAKMPKWTNINFVKRLELSSTWQMVQDSMPFYATNSMVASIDYMPVNSEKKRLQIRCDMFNSNDKVRLDIDEPLLLSRKALSIETLKADGYKSQDDDFWDEHRHAEMSSEQQKASSTIDSLNNVGAVRTFSQIAKAAITGYLDVGAVEIGSIGEMFNTNKIEGLHLGFGLRTSKEVSESFVLSGILGYGFKNTRPTYGAGIGYKFHSPMRRTIDVYYSDRVMKIGEDENILYLYENMLSTSETNLIAQLFKREEIDELMYCQKFKLSYDNEWYTGMQTRLQAIALSQESPKYYPFTQNGSPIKHVNQAEVSLDFRFSFREKFVDDGMQRMYLTTEYPIFHLTFAGGKAEAGDKSSTYARLHSTLKHRFQFGQTKLDIATESGIYFGKLPYTLLNIARGNKTYGFYQYDFNLMNYLEFVCDKYLYVHADYALDGFLFHKLPAIYKLGLREIIGAKVMLGSLSDRHKDMLDLPPGVGGPDKPYVELNAGIDNILRFFRLDAVWRAVGKSNVGGPKVGLRAQLNFKL